MVWIVEVFEKTEEIECEDEMSAEAVADQEYRLNGHLTRTYEREE